MFGSQPIIELDNQLKNVLRYSGYIMVGLCLGLILYPRDTLLMGMIIGIAVGIFNSVTLAKRIKRLPELRPDAAKKYMKRGLTMRLGLIMMVLFFVGRQFPQVSLFSVGAGLLIPTCVSIIFSMVETYNQYRQSNALIKRFYEE